MEYIHIFSLPRTGILILSFCKQLELFTPALVPTLIEAQLSVCIKNKIKKKSNYNLQQDYKRYKQYKILQVTKNKVTM